MRVCQFRHFGKWTTLRGSLAGYLSGRTTLYFTDASVPVKPTHLDLGRFVAIGSKRKIIGTLTIETGSRGTANTYNSFKVLRL
jgi:hypothetical protein